MTRLAFILAALLIHATFLTTAIDIQCQWPCSRESEVCQVISTATGWSARCQPLGPVQWVLVSPESNPVFYAKNPSLLPTLDQPCHLPPPGSPSTESCASGFRCTRPSSSSTHLTCTPLRQNHTLQRRENGSNFSSLTHHTTAFNVVHVIAAVVGIVGAALVGITAFIMCRRRRRLAARQHQQIVTIADSRETPMDRFNQFAQDYCRGNDDETRSIAPLPEAHTDKKALISPTMQQIHLHRQLLEQHQKRPPPPYQP